MKQILPLSGRVILLSFSFLFIAAITKAQDLPGAGANLQTAPAGTLVIAMDNTNQACSVIDSTSGTYLFNLKAYGLAVFLLDLDFNLQWIIRAGKGKDEIDFSALAERTFPTYAAPQTLDFRAGPILIYPSDTTGIKDVIDWFNSYQYDSSKVKVYRLLNDTQVDVRYTLAHRPRVAMLHDSCDIHGNFMEMASVPTMNYDCLPDASTLRSGCYTMATEPHSVFGDLTSFDADSIYNFVMAGGNFLAECEGVQTFESLKLYQSSTGVIIDPMGGQFQNFNNNVYYDNADMAYGQYDGTFSPWTRGAQKVWRYASANTNNFYSVTSTKRSAADDLYYVATVSKLTADTGSMVFYLGNHEYFTHDCHTCVSSNNINEQEINGIRLFLNAVLIPAKVPECAFQIPLAVQLATFSASKKNNESVELKWSSYEEEADAVYFLEHSITGNSFAGIGQVEARGSVSTTESYTYQHINPAPGTNYYRLKAISSTGKITYSEIKPVTFGNPGSILNIYPNPATGKTNLLLDAKDGVRLLLNFYDVAGRQSKQMIAVVHNQRAEIDLGGLHKGIYWMVAGATNGEQYKVKLIISE